MELTLQKRPNHPKVSCSVLLSSIYVFQDFVGGTVFIEVSFNLKTRRRSKSPRERTKPTVESQPAQPTTPSSTTLLQVPDNPLVSESKPDAIETESAPVVNTVELESNKDAESNEELVYDLIFRTIFLFREQISLQPCSVSRQWNTTSVQEQLCGQSFVIVPQVTRNYEHDQIHDSR